MLRRKEDMKPWQLEALEKTVAKPEKKSAKKQEVPAVEDTTAETPAVAEAPVKEDPQVEDKAPAEETTKKKGTSGKKKAEEKIPVEG